MANPKTPSDRSAGGDIILRPLYCVHPTQCALRPGCLTGRARLGPGDAALLERNVLWSMVRCRASAHHSQHRSTLHWRPFEQRTSTPQRHPDLWRTATPVRTLKITMTTAARLDLVSNILLQNGHATHC